MAFQAVAIVIIFLSICRWVTCKIEQNQWIGMSWVLLLIATVGYAQPPVEVPNSVKRKYLRDAARLTLRLAAQEEDLRFQRISIPRQPMMEIYNVLISIYQSDERARAVERCNVHTFPSPSIDRCVVIFDREVEWAAPLRQGISETNNPEINQLLDEYDLIIEKHVQWNDRYDALTIRATEPLNMAALANEFYNVEGVVEVDLGIPDVRGSDITLKPLPNGSWAVTYILRFGSLFAEQDQVHTWTWHVFPNGQVQFVRESGAPIPAWMRCHFEASDERWLVRSY